MDNVGNLLVGLGDQQLLYSFHDCLNSIVVPIYADSMGWFRREGGDVFFFNFQPTPANTNLLLDAMRDSKVADVSFFQMEVNWQGKDFAKNTIGLTGGEGRSVLFSEPRRVNASWCSAQSRRRRRRRFRLWVAGSLCWPTDPFALLAMLANQPTHPPLI